MVDHVDILKDGASAVYGSDAIAGVVNFFLIHKFRGLEIGGTYGNTNMGASNDMGEWEAWIKAGTGDDKTDIVVVADFWQRIGGVFSATAIFLRTDSLFHSEASRRAAATSLGVCKAVGCFPGCSSLLLGQQQFGVNSPLPHSAPNAAHSPFYKSPYAVNPNAYPGAPGILNPIGFNAPGFPQSGTNYNGGGNYFFFNFAAFTPALPPGDRQVYYGSFTRDLCDKYLTVFGDFKYARSFFDSSLAAVPFTPDPFHNPSTGTFFSPTGISVPLTNPFNPFTVADATIPNFFPDGSGLPVTTGVRFRGINDTGPRFEKFTYWDQFFDFGLRGEMSYIGDYFKTWNWEAGFRYSRNEGQDLSVGEASQPGLRQALLDTDPATAFNPFLGINGINSAAARSQVYVTLHNSGEYELPIYYATFNGDLFNLPAGPVSFAIGGEYDAPRFTVIGTR